MCRFNRMAETESFRSLSNLRVLAKRISLPVPAHSVKVQLGALGRKESSEVSQV